VPRRIVIAGISGSGKTTLGRRLAQKLDVPFTELDALMHQPGWVSWAISSCVAPTRLSGSISRCRSCCAA
jgi:adenylate kinase family enzyme